MWLSGRSYLGLAAVVALCVPGTLAAPAEESLIAFSFRQQIAAKAGEGIPFEWAELICEARLAAGSIATGYELAFIGAEGRGAEIWAIAGFEISDLSQLWTGGPLGDDPGSPPTPEWGWIYDRNGDGRIDWLAAVDTPRAMLPAGISRGALPNLFHDPVSFTAAQLDMVNANARLGYWHVVDSNFDGAPDGILVLPTDSMIGWTDGAMWLTLSDSGITDCLWRSDTRPTAREPCAERDGVFETTGRGPPLEAQTPVAFLVGLFKVVARTAQACDLGESGIEPGP